MKKLLLIIILSLLLSGNVYSDLIDSIKELNNLYKEGIITKEEFSNAKNKAIEDHEEAPKKSIEESNVNDYWELLYKPDEGKINEWKRFKNSSSNYNVWVEIRKNGSFNWSYSWRGRSTLKQALKGAFEGCNKRVKDRPKRDFKKSDLCIPIFVNFHPGKARKTSYEEKIKYIEEYYGKKRSDKFFKKNSWALK